MPSHARSLAGLVLLVALAACTVPVGVSPADMSVDPGPSAPSSAAASPGPIDAAAAVLDAVAELLELDGAQVTIAVDRWKGETGPERLIHGAGELEPAASRGRMRYDLSTLLEIPGMSPSPLDVVDVAWDETTLWGRPTGGDWSEATRQDAAENGGLVGRLPNEVLGLPAVVAEAAPHLVTELAAEDGALRYLVSVPVEAAARMGVPSDTPNADVVREAYGIDAIPVEVWVREAEVVRLRYRFEREKALYGGPDRTQVTYDWVTDPSIRIELPPSG